MGPDCHPPRACSESFGGGNSPLRETGGLCTQCTYIETHVGRKNFHLLELPQNSGDDREERGGCRCATKPSVQVCFADTRNELRREQGQTFDLPEEEFTINWAALPFSSENGNPIVPQPRTNGFPNHENFVAQKPRKLFKIYSYDRYLKSFNISQKTPGGTENQVENSEKLPIYVPNLPAIKVQALAVHTNEQEQPSFSTIWLTDPEQYSRCLRHLPVSSRQPIDIKEFTDDEWELLKERGYLKQLAQKPKCYGKMWGHEEKEKHRRRLILHPKQLNDAVRKHANVSCRFPTCKDIRTAVRNHEVVVAFDMKCFFYQFELSPTVASYFSLRRGRQDYSFCKLPMGFTAAPRIAQETSLNLAKAAWGTTFKYEVLIDNIFVFLEVNDQQQIAEVTQKFIDTSNRFSATIGSIQTITEEGEVLGVTYNMQRKTVDTPTSFKEIHMKDMENALSLSTQTISTWWRTCAVLLWCSMARGRRLGENFELIKLMSRIASFIQSDWKTFENAMWTLTEGQHARIRKAVNSLFFSGHTPIRDLTEQASTDADVYVDACTGTKSDIQGGLGVYVVHEDQIYVWSRRAQKADIGSLELDALLFGGECVSTLRATSPAFYTDSRVVHDQVARGYGKSWSENARIQKFRLQFEHSPVHWIPGEDNPADAPSRNI